MSNFRSIDRETGFLFPPSIDDWLPEKHLARFVVEVIDGLDLSAMIRSYRGSGSASYHPALFITGNEPVEWEKKPAKNRQKDKDARWTKKHGKSFFGYKTHVN